MRCASRGTDARVCWGCSSQLQHCKQNRIDTKSFPLPARLLRRIISSTCRGRGNEELGLRKIIADKESRDTLQLRTTLHHTTPRHTALLFIFTVLIFSQTSLISETRGHQTK